MPHALRRWTPLALGVVAVLMALDPAPTLLGRFDSARRAAGHAGTYQGWIKAMRLVGRRMLGVTRPRLRTLVRAAAGARWEIGGFVPFVVDGGKFDAPRTIANEALGLAGKLGCGPQALACIILHLGSGLLWDWRLGGACSSERHLLLAMLRSLPPRTLLIMDAGFVGYDFLRTLHERGLSFLVRVGENVTLRTTPRGGRVLLRRKDRPHEPPLELRLVRVGRVHLITSVLEPERLSASAAAGLYQRRWDVEVFFRTIKQTMQRRKMRSASPVNALIELDWTFVGAGVLGLLGAHARAGRGVDPTMLSMAGALEAARASLRRPAASSAAPLRHALASAARDRYTRRCPKTSYRWPHKKHDHPPGIPRILAA